MRFVTRKRYILSILIIALCVSWIYIIYSSVQLKSIDNKITEEIQNDTYKKVKDLEGMKVRKEIFNELSITKKGGRLIFTKPLKSCGLCLLSALSIWSNMRVDGFDKKVNQPVILLSDNKEKFIRQLSMMEYKPGIKIKDYEIKVRSKIINYFLQDSTTGICLFIDEVGRILYAELLSEINLKNVESMLARSIKYNSDYIINN